jgi:hypothetical protein
MDAFAQANDADHERHDYYAWLLACLVAANPDLSVYYATMFAEIFFSGRYTGKPALDDPRFRRPLTDGVHHKDLIKVLWGLLDHSCYNCTAKCPNCMWPFPRHVFDNPTCWIYTLLQREGFTCVCKDPVTLLRREFIHRYPAASQNFQTAAKQIGLLTEWEMQILDGTKKELSVEVAFCLKRDEHKLQKLLDVLTGADSHV